MLNSCASPNNIPGLPVAGNNHTNRNLGHLLCLSYFLFFDTQRPSLQSHGQPLVKKSIFFDCVCRLRLA